MIPIPWNRRTIPYGRSLDELPVLLERLLGTAERLQHMYTSASREKLLARVDGRWAAVDHLAHLLTLQERFVSRVEDFEHRRSMLCEIDLRDQGALIEQRRARSVVELLDEFRLKRLRFTSRIEQMRYQTLMHQAQHPCQRRELRPVDMLLWIAEHDDHHLASVRSLLNGPINLPRPPLWPE